MSSRRFLTSVAFQVERAASGRSLGHAPLLTPASTPYNAARFLPSSAGTTIRPLSTTTSLHRQESRPSVTTANTSSQDPNRAASAESTTPSAAASVPAESQIYTYEDMQRFTAAPDPHRILIDVREPAELAATGHIPTALNIPITSAPDALFLPEQEFEERFGFQRPGVDTEVVFYCKSGVRSRAAARLAQQAHPRFGGRVAEFPGSWNEWEGKGGRVERG